MVANVANEGITITVNNGNQDANAFQSTLQSLQSGGRMSQAQLDNLVFKPSAMTNGLSTGHSHGGDHGGHGETARLVDGKMKGALPGLAADVGHGQTMDPSGQGTDNAQALGYLTQKYLGMSLDQAKAYAREQMIQNGGITPEQAGDAAQEETVEAMILGAMRPEALQGGNEGFDKAVGDDLVRFATTGQAPNQDFAMLARMLQNNHGIAHADGLNQDGAFQAWHMGGNLGYVDGKLSSHSGQDFNNVQDLGKGQDFLRKALGGIGIA